MSNASVVAQLTACALNGRLDQLPDIMHPPFELVEPDSLPATQVADRQVGFEQATDGDRLRHRSPIVARRAQADVPRALSSFVLIAVPTTVASVHRLRLSR